MSDSIIAGQPGDPSALATIIAQGISTVFLLAIIHYLDRAFDQRLF